MSEIIIVQLISSACVLVGTIVTAIYQHNKDRTILKVEQDHIKDEIEKLTERVDVHNNYAVEIPLIQKDIAYIKEQIK